MDHSPVLGPKTPSICLEYINQLINMGGKSRFRSHWISSGATVRYYEACNIVTISSLLKEDIKRGNFTALAIKYIKRRQNMCLGDQFIMIIHIQGLVRAHH